METNPSVKNEILQLPIQNHMITVNDFDFLLICYLQSTIYSYQPLNYL